MWEGPRKNILETKVVIRIAKVEKLLFKVNYLKNDTPQGNTETAQGSE